MPRPSIPPVPSPPARTSNTPGGKRPPRHYLEGHVRGHVTERRAGASGPGSRGDVLVGEGETRPPRPPDHHLQRPRIEKLTRACQATPASMAAPVSSPG